MTDDLRIRDDHIAAWLGEGAARAPEGLAARVRDGARHVDQRPALVARAAGAPSGGAALVTVRMAWLLLAAALLAVAMILAAVLAGRPRDEPLPAIVVATATPGAPSHALTPSLSPSPAATVAPTNSPGPTPTATPPAPTRTPAVAAAPMTVYENQVLGFSIDLPGDATDRGPMAVHDEGDGSFTVDRGRCLAPDLCLPAAIVSSGTPQGGALVHRDYDSRGVLTGSESVHGTDLDSLKASWTQVMGTSDFHASTVDGIDAVYATRAGLHSILFIHGGRTWAISTAPQPFFGGMSTIQDLADVRDAFHFMPITRPYPDPLVSTTVGTETPVTVSFRAPGDWAIEVNRDGSATVETKATMTFLGPRLDQLIDIRAFPGDLDTRISKYGSPYARMTPMDFGDDRGALLLGRGDSATTPATMAVIEHAGTLVTVTIVDHHAIGGGEDVLRRVLATLRVTSP